jgi:hypothetical protein
MNGKLGGGTYRFFPFYLINGNGIELHILALDFSVIQIGRQNGYMNIL